MRINRVSYRTLSLLVIISFLSVCILITFSFMVDTTNLLPSINFNYYKNNNSNSSIVKDDDIEIRLKSLDSFNGTFPTVKDATFFTICRNSDLNGIAKSIHTVEKRFNKNHHYPWVFANDVPFTKEFKDSISLLVSGDAIFTTIPKEYWNVPDSIDKVLMKNQFEMMKENKVLYGDNLSYRQMCRFNSGFFYKLKALEKFNWYWRVEPDVRFTCDLPDDMFETMINENKTYGFIIAMGEDKKTIRKLWKTSRDYFENLPSWNLSIQDGEKYIKNPDNNSLGFIETDYGSKTSIRGNYNLCHYWSNFEIANLNFFRDPIYEGYFQALDETGNFFYERWGDAPIHSIAVSYLLKPDQIKYFDNTGYYHGRIGNCPREKQSRNELNCRCAHTNEFSWKFMSCVPRWFTGLNIEPPRKPHYR